MKLQNFTKQTIVKVDYSDVEKLIFETYKQRYEIMPMEEVGSSQYAAVIEKTVKPGLLTQSEEHEIEQLVLGQPQQWIFSTILKDLCNKGLIDEGDYIISVNW